MSVNKAMSLSVAFRFLVGRYHATPFGHHVNEGLVEWPPSPWRVLRALISAGYATGTWDSTESSVIARSLIEKLSDDLPCYYLPPAVSAHSRHYMPIGKLGNDRCEKTTLVFDTWLQVGEQELVIFWDNVRLDQSELSICNALVESLNYLGRAESWVAGRVLQESELVPQANCFPERPETTDGWEQVFLLAAMSTSDFSDWKKDQGERAIEPYPDKLLDCLQKDTNWWRSHGWSWPPGSQRMFYWRQSNAISDNTLNSAVMDRSDPRIKAMLLSLTNASRNDSALPSVTRTLPQAELLHRAFVKAATHHGIPPSELTGRDSSYRPLQGPHEHAHINPLDLDGDGCLDHILVWAPKGLGADAQTAIRVMRKTFTKGGVDKLHLALAGAGDMLDLIRLPSPYGRDIACLACCASSWQSVTPFVPPRYIKTYGKNTLEGQIRAELKSRGFPNPVAITVAERGGGVDEKTGTIWSRFRHFKLVRKWGPKPPSACGFAIRLEFDPPISGPLSLGYGSHFGLGLFKGLA